MASELPRFDRDESFQESIQESAASVITEIRKAAEVEVKAVSDFHEASSAVMLVICIFLGSGAITLFAADTYAFLYEVKYQPVSHMPWCLAGLVSSCSALLIVLFTSIFGNKS